jgi:hypothetical protein
LPDTPEIGKINPGEKLTGDAASDETSTDCETPRALSPPLASDGDRREAFLRHVLGTWQPLSGRELSLEDARQIAENLTGFFGVLLRWQERRETNKRGRAAQTADPMIPTNGGSRHE